MKSAHYFKMVATTRRKSSAPKPPPLSRENKIARKQVILNVAREVFSLRGGSDRGARYGVIGKELKSAQNLYPWLTKGMVQNQVENLMKEQTKGCIVVRDNMDDREEVVAARVAAATGTMVIASTYGHPKGTSNEKMDAFATRKCLAADTVATDYLQLKKKGRRP